MFKIFLASLIFSISCTAAQATTPSRGLDKSGCFMRGQSLYVCANNIKNNVYTVSVLDPAKSPFPATMLLECKWKPEAQAYGTMPPIFNQQFVDSLCKKLEDTPLVPSDEEFNM